MLLFSVEWLLPQNRPSSMTKMPSEPSRRRILPSAQAMACLSLARSRTGASGGRARACSCSSVYVAEAAPPAAVGVASVSQPAPFQKPLSAYFPLTDCAVIVTR